MLNPATRSRSELNDFTALIRDGAGKVRVRLRNGEIERPEWLPAADPTCEDCFMTDDKCWEPNGVSVTRPDYDMMELV